MAGAGAGSETPEAEEFATAVGALLGTDAIEKINAGAQLIYALYHHPRAKDLFTNDEFMTQGLAGAYMRAQSAYGIGG